jgi:hypothetical protein
MTTGSTLKTLFRCVETSLWVLIHALFHCCNCCVGVCGDSILRLDQVHGCSTRVPLVPTPVVTPETATRVRALIESRNGGCVNKQNV